MNTVATALVILVLLEHVYFMVLEMFLWKTPKAQKAFGMTEEFAKSTATLAANQGLYNGFLAMGLLWSLFAGPFGYQLQIFFLGCIVVAGVFGAITVTKKILFLQAAPAIIRSERVDG